MWMTGQQANLSQPLAASRLMFHPINMIYVGLADTYIGFEDAMFYGYLWKDNKTDIVYTQEYEIVNGTSRVESYYVASILIISCTHRS